MTSPWPKNVGIKAIELYFPSQFVDQTELEVFDKAPVGKYTVGLGQSKMGFCSDREDINSLCLTVVSNLMERYSIDPIQIGRLEVGTETIIDKSKSVKTVLMQLFEKHNATDLEGLDTTNACFGGTAALFNAINWVESSSWDGRLAMVVCGDIAVYAKGPARPTGGAGAVAMLIGPDAPLVFDRFIRSTYMEHAYDFYKPDLSSEHPVVDGPLSIKCYLSALDNCYQLYNKKYAKLHPNDTQTGLERFDAVIFHTPFCKLVQKSVARLGLNDFMSADSTGRKEKFGDDFNQFSSTKLEDTYFDRDVEKAFMIKYTSTFNAKTKKSLFVSNQVGNMYTPSVYSGLCSLLINNDIADLVGKSIGVFSYGSGFAGAMYSISTTQNTAELETITSKLAHLLPMLDKREKVAPETFTKMMEIRNSYSAPYEPCGSVDTLFPGTFYLKNIDDQHRRVYARVPPN